MCELLIIVNLNHALVLIYHALMLYCFLIPLLMHEHFYVRWITSLWFDIAWKMMGIANHASLYITTRPGTRRFMRKKTSSSHYVSTTGNGNSKQVFLIWKDFETLRINSVNYGRFMNSYFLNPSFTIYNSIIHGFAQKGDVELAKSYLDKMVEDGLEPEPETYNGLIQAYGNYKMYDEMNKCVKKMESDGYPCDENTYNILITEFAKGGLLGKMEKMYQTLLSKGFILRSAALIATVEAYANFGILDKMEKFYRKVLYSKVFIKEELIRKMAYVYIDNYRFSRLEELGLEISSKIGWTDLVWCLMLLSHAYLLSKRGIQSVIQKMEESRAKPNITFINIILLTYLKMRDLRNFRICLSQIHMRKLKPDMVTVGVLFDACSCGFGGSSILKSWRKNGILDEPVEMNTDPLVLIALGKGNFIRDCEEVYTSLEPKAREKKEWTYNELIDLVLKTKKGVHILTQGKVNLHYPISPS